MAYLCVLWELLVLLVVELVVTFTSHISLGIDRPPSIPSSGPKTPIGSVQWQRPQIELSRGLAPPSRVRNLHELLEQLVQMS